jgi:hypothetical protein
MNLYYRVDLSCYILGEPLPNGNLKLFGTETGISVFYSFDRFTIEHVEEFVDANNILTGNWSSYCLLSVTNVKFPLTEHHPELLL